ncbi:UDP-N-acetylmuramate dehydrogenase [Leeia sp. TBRC 13508]|uniref:UDP-N-acetylenolpyruvoylglucosamine reductase n=1 Tax=Leeia speluncae TaxID=2884804 RepID=A0ABS8D5F7_9NEIS|nr:UDP-N-acetylmuramate dehydrogenase [Leeia speluncae]MCB6182853.1 UDP-N-acetylmuramate dehydrogenase [Leeia speluncae]
MALHIQENVSLLPFHTFGIPCEAKWLVEVDAVETLSELKAHPTLSSQPWLVLGGGSNLLPTKDYAGLVLRMTAKGKRIIKEDDDHVWIKAEAGENWHDFVQWTLANQWYGLENLSLIPGTVGASPIQNIGAYGVEVKDCFESLTAWHKADDTVITLSNADCQFGYRDSIFKQALKDKAIILSVTFRLNKQPSLKTAYGEIAKELANQHISEPTPRHVADAVIAIRQRKLPDPTQIGNAGSFFKNPVIATDIADEIATRFPNVVRYPAGDGLTKLAAGWLIDQCGWKGKSLGNAGVYEQQALVLVNRGGATGEEVLALSNAIIKSVQDTFGVTLEPEPIIL